MDEQQIMQTINLIEHNFPVNKWSVNGIDFWPIFRIIASYSLLKLKNNKDKVSYKITESPKNLPTISQAFNNQEVDILFFSDSQYRVQLNSIWYNRLSDPFYEITKKMGYTAINLDFSYQNASKIPVIENTFSIQNQLIAVTEMKEFKNLDMQLEKFDMVREKLLQLTKDESDIPSPLYIKWITTQILYWKKFFREILIRKKIKCVFIVNYYQVISYALILAARELNIPSVDIQHGNHRSLFYSNWINVPIGGYNTLPTYFWCWSKKYELPIKDWVCKTEQHRVVVGGNPWLEIWKKENHFLTQYYEQEVNKYINSSNVNILLTLQPRYALVGWEYNIPNWVIETIKDSPPNWKFLIRYHQQMVYKFQNEHDFCEKQLAEFIVNEKVETLKSTELPLPALLKQVDIHITAFSTCVIEAKEFNIPSITLHKHSKIYFQKEIGSGWVVEAGTKQELFQAINKQVEFKKRINETKVDYNEILFEDTINRIVSSNNTFNYHNQALSKETLFDIFLKDKEYHKIIDGYEDVDTYKEVLYVAYAYKGLGDIKSELKFTINALEKALINPKIVTNEEIKLFTKRLITEECFEQYAEEIVSLISERKYILGEICKYLFDNLKYDEVLKLCDFSGCTELDSLYYSGRSLIHKNCFKEALDRMNKYTALYNNIEEKSITKSKNFIISAFFYIGKIHMELNNTELAVENLKKCLSYSHGNHQQASILLKELI